MNEPSRDDREVGYAVLLAGHPGVGPRRLAELLDGPTQDYNLIWRRDRIDAQLLHRPLVGPMVFFAEADVRWAIYVLSGHARVKDHPNIPRLELGDTALVESGNGESHRMILDGAGELLLVRLAPVVDEA